MIKTGMTRRIDELGRIVLPKEIRNSLKIKPGDLLSIYINENETIYLKKYSIINKNDQIIESLLSFISKKLKINIFITDLNKIVFSNEKSIIGKNVDKEYKNYIIHDIISNGDTIGNVYIEKNIKDEEIFLLNFFYDFLEKYYENE